MELMKKIESLLDHGETSDVRFKLSDEFFVEELGQSLPADQEQAHFIIFSRLAAHFLHGLLFFKGTTGWHPVLAFAYGKKIPISSLDRGRAIALPEVPPGEVWKAKSEETLMSLGFSKLFTDPELTTVLFQIRTGYSLLLTSPLGDPWLKTRLELIQNLFQQQGNLRLTAHNDN